MEDITLKTKDGKEVSLAFLNRSKTFRLGLQAGKEGWGQEGGAWQKNGPAFRTGWWAEQALRPNAKGMEIPYNEADIRTAIEDDVKKAGDARLGGEPTGIYFTFLIGRDNRDYGYDDIYTPGVSVHFTMESVEYEHGLFKGLNTRLAVISFQSIAYNPKVNGTAFMLDDSAFAEFVHMIRWAKEKDRKYETRALNGICQCLFPMMFAERTLRKWFADGFPKHEHIKILEA